MQPVIETYKIMKKENLLAVAGVIILVVIYALQFKTMQESSPLALLIIVITGLLLSMKYKLVGNTLLFFGCLALAVHPFLFSSSYWLLPGAALAGYSGFSGLINWWRNDK